MDKKQKTKNPHLVHRSVFTSQEETEIHIFIRSCSFTNSMCLPSTGDKAQPSASWVMQGIMANNLLRIRFKQASVVRAEKTFTTGAQVLDN